MYSIMWYNMPVWDLVPGNPISTYSVHRMNTNIFNSFFECDLVWLQLIALFKTLIKAIPDYSQVFWDTLSIYMSVES